MKMVKRFSALLLTLIMIVACCVTPAAAEVRPYGTEESALYLSLGDSIARGIGSTDWTRYNNEKTCPGSFTATVATALGYSYSTDADGIDAGNATNAFVPCHYNGTTTGSILELLGLGGEDSFFHEIGHYTSAVAAFGQGGGSRLDTLLKSANLITIELGMCDVFYKPFSLACEAAGINWQTASLDSVSTEDLITVFTTFLSLIQSGYEEWYENYPVLLQYIKENNPDATIVMVGSFNIAGNVSILDSAPVKSGDVFDSMIACMSACYRQWATEFDVLYADVSQVRAAAGEYDWSFTGSGFWQNIHTSTHPSQNGYNQMAQTILNVLPEASAVVPQPASPSTDIVLDLGSYDSVRSVQVNDRDVTGYEVSDHTLTIHYGHKGGTSATVTMDGKNGSTVIRTYRLSFDPATGYDACRTATILIPAQIAVDPATQKGVKRSVSHIRSVLTWLFGK